MGPRSPPLDRHSHARGCGVDRKIARDEIEMAFLHIERVAARLAEGKRGQQHVQLV